MRTDFDLPGVQPTYRRLCPFCGRRFYETMVRRCQITGRAICIYCCRKGCGEWYLSPTGQGCREFDRKREAKKHGRK